MPRLPLDRPAVASQPEGAGPAVLTGTEKDMDNNSGGSSPGIRTRFVRLIGVIYLATGLVTMLLFVLVTRRMARKQGEQFAVLYSLRDKDRILAPIQREVALARKLVDTPLLIEWARDEDDP